MSKLHIHKSPARVFEALGITAAAHEVMLPLQSHEQIERFSCIVIF